MSDLLDRAHEVVARKDSREDEVERRVLAEAGGGGPAQEMAEAMALALERSFSQVVERRPRRSSQK